MHISYTHSVSPHAPLLYTYATEDKIAKNFTIVVAEHQTKCRPSQWGQCEAYKKHPPYKPDVTQSY
jgi:hypothetical protein